MDGKNEIRMGESEVLMDEKVRNCFSHSLL